MTTDIILSSDETTRLVDCERTIERGLATFYEVGEALMTIRDSRLYRQSHKTFEDYCRERWGMSKTHTNRLIQAADVVDNLTPIGVIPTTESQARALAKLEPEQQRDVWQHAIETAPNGKPTAAHIAQTAIAQAPPPIRKEAPAHPNMTQPDYDTNEWYTPGEYIEAVGEEITTAGALQIADGKKRHQRMTITVYSSESNEWYTPPWVTERARAVMGSIDLDPASSIAAQTIHRATAWFGPDHPDPARWDGLGPLWAGNVWLNPPYGRSEDGHNAYIWSRKLIDEYRAGRVSAGILLVKAALGYNWFEELWRILPVCFLRERLSFVRPDGRDDGQSKQATALFYVGNDVAKFDDVFGPYGRIIPPPLVEVAP